MIKNFCLERLLQPLSDLAEVLFVSSKAPQNGLSLKGLSVIAGTLFEVKSALSCGWSRKFVVAGALIVCMLFAVACKEDEVDVGTLREEAKIVEGVSSTETMDSAAWSRKRLMVDLGMLQSFARELSQMAAEMRRLQSSVKLKERGYYTSEEHDAIAALLFRYLMFRESLWDIVLRYSDYEMEENKQAQAEGFVMGLHAALLLYNYSSLIVETFMEEEAVVDKLNEAYEDFGVEDKTFDRIFGQVTYIDNIDAIQDAFAVFREGMDDPHSTISQVVHSNKALGGIARLNKDLYSASQKRVDQILKENSIILPELRNVIRHSVVNEIAKSGEELVRDNLYVARGLLFENVSRVKNPMEKILVFSDEQVDALESKLQPGDIILTYTAGYMSNVFLPGMFKHGITYVGSVEQRKAIGLDRMELSHLPKAKQEEYIANVSVDKLDSGEGANLIEAVAEGVIFNSLGHVMDTHINRLLVLRPKLSAEQRLKQLNKVFLLLGSTYDFRFDFGDASYQCCTEVIYRSLHAQGGFSFDLVSRMGTPTLSADDIIDYFVSMKDKPFSFVAFAEGDADGKGQAAVVRYGEKGLQHFLKRWEGEK